ncbi:RUS family member 1 isoform X2 [Coccinella septempunctata]|uniref:RUS family member 1 isoform X2 n=1 Tax=Coccinella septempunctata TaxID=41139 RepID=UPI001D08BE12|nr:RUS family member 1 isoform X2 [Coccinella septempunctata]
MKSESLLTETYGTKVIRYQQKNPLRIERIESKPNIGKNLWLTVAGFFKEILLPYGYPDSVSTDYFEYQLWDTLQAFCSTIVGSFTTRAILKGVGVGDAEASALSATITWIMKDGSGMIGRIFFAWWKGNMLDCNCKKWRLFADGLNNIAMLIEIGIPFYSGRSMEILCLTSMMKSIVGIAGGATRASITNHQAKQGNMAEISAKDGTQETVVNLFASFTSLYLLSKISNPLIVLVLREYFKNNSLNPSFINSKESVILGFGLKVSDICNFKIKLGSSLRRIVKLFNFQEMEQVLQLYKDKPYLVISDVERKCIYVALEKKCEPLEILRSYVHAVMLAVATCFYNNIPLKVQVIRKRNYTNFVARLETFMKSINKNTEHYKNMTPSELKLFNEFVQAEITMFFVTLNVNEWNSNFHSLCMEQWKTNWKHGSKKNE